MPLRCAVGVVHGEDEADQDGLVMAWFVLGYCMDSQPSSQEEREFQLLTRDGNLTWPPGIKGFQAPGVLVCS